MKATNNLDKRAKIQKEVSNVIDDAQKEKTKRLKSLH